mmetsp:Transcript_36985/g.90193  ORF Transcript_36985/g.90193 Transcript_36985/m.90193 type:complete len:681 (-) Transcript_36985:713-2755(-)
MFTLNDGAEERFGCASSSPCCSEGGSSCAPLEMLRFASERTKLTVSLAPLSLRSSSPLLPPASERASAPLPPSDPPAAAPAAGPALALECARDLLACRACSLKESAFPFLPAAAAADPLDCASASCLSSASWRGGEEVGGGGGGGGMYGGGFRNYRGTVDPYQAGVQSPQAELEIFGPPKTMEEAAVASTVVDFDQYENIPVQVDGRDCLGGITDFASLNLPPVLEHNIHLSGYNKPTPIQKHTIPAALGARDVMACAQTGSGKTAAFLLPTVARLLGSPLPIRERRRSAPSALVLSPTRELTVQIFGEARKFCYSSGIRPVVCYGGAPVVEQLRELERGCELLVGTPGRLVDLLDRGRVIVSAVRTFILDEADRMLDMGFEPQIRRIAQQFGMPQPPERQTLMFSATFPPPIQRLARDFGRDYVFVTIGRVGSTVNLITQRVEYVPEPQKQQALVQLLMDVEGLTLVFVETKRAADVLEHSLSSQGLPASSIHGDRSQYEREHALAQFRAGRTRILVATDVAARGLDIPNVAHVINYDFPSDIDNYVHRIGRTGRAGRKGLATAFVNETSNKHALEDLVQIFLEAGIELPPFLATTRRGRGNSSGRSGRGKGGRGGYGKGRGKGAAFYGGGGGACYPNGHYGRGGGGYGGGAPPHDMPSMPTQAYPQQAFVGYMAQAMQ